ncbi:MAG: restriction endonuclease [Candidatus Saccharimonadales bacterium]
MNYRNARRYGPVSSTRDHMLFLLVILIASSIYSFYNTLYPRFNSHFYSLIAYASILIISSIALFLAIKFVFRNSQVSQNIAQIDKMSGIEFEQFVGDLLKKQDYSYIAYTERYDLGVDILAQKDKQVWGIQVKRSKSPVSTHAVRQVVTALKYYDCDQGMVITNNSFTRAARKLAKSNDCILLERKNLLKWMRK